MKSTEAPDRSLDDLFNGSVESGMITSKSPRRFFPCLRDTIRCFRPPMQLRERRTLSSETVADKFSEPWDRRRRRGWAYRVFILFS